MLNLERLRVLHAVATTGSVRGAASALHVTTSAVSQQLARLEREVGQRLLERSGRGVRLTEAALLLAGRAARVLAEMEHIEAELAAHRGAVTGTLGIAAFATAARGLLPGVVAALRDRHPELSAGLSEREPDEAVAALCRADVDVAVVQDWPEAPLALPQALESEWLFDDLFDVALPSAHPRAGDGAVALADLEDEDWIAWSDGQLCHDWLGRTLRDHGSEARIVHTASEHSTQLALVAAGLGVALVPRLGREPTPSGVRFLALRPAPQRRVHVVWRCSAAGRPAVRAVVNSLRERGRTRRTPAERLAAPA